MNLYHPHASVYVPDQRPLPAALEHITHLGIGAHQDDLEIMAFHGIQTCRHQTGLSFGGITCTDGGGSARGGRYAGYSDEAMRQVRIAEQNQAAAIGGYGVMIQLGHPSAEVKSPHHTGLRTDLITLLNAMQPRVIYTHNPADKHDTHIGVMVAVVEAVRALPPARRPEQLLGCEVWRGLDWMVDEDKQLLPVGGQDHLFQSLVGLFDSQIAGGKRYDLATLGRARANATYHQSHQVDASDLLWFAMDLTPLIREDSLDLETYVNGYLERFVSDVRARLARRLGN